MASRTRKAAEAAPTDESTAQGTDVTPADNGTEQGADVTAQDHDGPTAPAADETSTPAPAADGDGGAAPQETPVTGPATEAKGADSLTGEPGALHTANGEMVGGVSADGFTREANAPVTAPTVQGPNTSKESVLRVHDDAAKDVPVNEHGQTVEQARAEVKRANDPANAAVNLAAPLDAPPSAKAQEVTKVEDPNEGISVPRALVQHPTTATPVITDGARLVDVEGNDIEDPESIFTAPEGPAQFVVVNQRVLVIEGVQGSKNTTTRLLFPKGAKVHRSTVGVFAAEWAAKRA